MLQRYIVEYLDDFPFSFTERICSQLCGVDITVDVMMFEGGYQRRQKAQLQLDTEGRRYECLCVDIHNWENMFYPVTLNDRQLLCFRKSLYGFTLLDAETLEEVYEYFPTPVLAGEESFIIEGAETRFGLLFFEGCYWADVYGIFVFDPTTKQFANLSNAAGMGEIDSGMQFEGDQLVLKSDAMHKPPQEARLKEQDIRDILARVGTADM